MIVICNLKLNSPTKTFCFVLYLSLHCRNQSNSLGLDRHLADLNSKDDICYKNFILEKINLPLVCILTSNQQYLICHNFSFT